MLYAVTILSLVAAALVVAVVLLYRRVRLLDNHLSAEILLLQMDAQKLKKKEAQKLQLGGMKASYDEEKKTLTIDGNLVATGAIIAGGK